MVCGFNHVILSTYYTEYAVQIGKVQVHVKDN